VLGDRQTRISRALLAILVATTFGTACADNGTGDDGVLTIYTSVTQDTVDAVVDGFETTNPGTIVEVFRAPTGELTARIATELRNDDLRADVLWLTDPLSIQHYDRDDLLKEWTPDNIDVVPEEFRTDSFFGTRVLNMIIITNDQLSDPPKDWAELPSVEGGVALPDPGFAGSAFAALGFFALDPGYGMDFYRELSASGGIQVRSPGDVVSGVAEGIYMAGITLDRSARAALDDGSPIAIVWPESGAISLYSPIAVVDTTGTETAERFVEYVLTEEAQTAIARTGWEPVREDVEWPDMGSQQTIDWSQAFDRQDELLADYQESFGR
jgi:iron(III) transport system substrate-binding protein